jgi:hypothetical protein
MMVVEDKEVIEASIALDQKYIVAAQGAGPRLREFTCFPE